MHGLHAVRICCDLGFPRSTRKVLTLLRHLQSGSSVIKCLLSLCAELTLFGGDRSWSACHRAIMGTRRSSTLQNILSKYFFNDSVNNQCSPLTSADASEALSTDVAASADPLDRSALIARLQTFQPGHWFAKPSEASALACASHGWTNSGVDTLQCPCCSSVLSWPGKKARLLGKPDPEVALFVSKLRSGHHTACPWAHPQPTHQELVAFPTCQSEPICQAFVDRMSKLTCLEGLPSIGSKGLQKLVDGRLEQILNLLDASHIPVKKSSPDDQAEGGISSIHDMSMLTRRSSAFAQTAKLLALLGWTVQPLAGRSPNADGEYCMQDCMLKCTACGSFMGLWSLDAAPETFGKLGHHGLVGQWGPGRQAHSRSLREFSIAGGLVRDSGGHSASGDELVASAPIMAPDELVAPFGVAAAGPVFGSSISLAANAKATRAPLGAKKPKHSVASPKSVVVGKKRIRDEPEADAFQPVQSRVVKVMKKLSATQQCHLDADVAQKLKDRGLKVCTQGALDIVHGHRSWCPWVFPEGVEGWRRALNAVVPEIHDDDDRNLETMTATSDRVDASGDVNMGRSHRRSSSILHSVGAFLNRFNHGQVSTEVETD